MIIGLSGYARSGKDTAADHLVNEYGFTRYSFAAPMKEAMYRLNPIVHSDQIAVSYTHLTLPTN
jgi:dephospho-CoA kinase